MHLKIPNRHVQDLVRALQRAGNKETGGQLFGEMIAPSLFRVTELTVQAKPGTFTRFVIDVAQAARDAFSFFERTEKQFTRFNYIGEWHSHPNYEVRPSSVDERTMRELVSDGTFRGNFAVLMIARLDEASPKLSAWVYDPHGNESEVKLEVCDVS